MPVFNGALWLKDSIESAIAMMSVNDELIIIDDGSTDESRGILELFETIDARVRIFHRSHEGLVSALNFGISQARFDFIARADSDDLYHSSRLEYQIKYLQENQNCAAVFCDYQVIDSKGNNLGVIPSAITPNLVLLSLLNHQRTPHPGVVFRKKYFLSAGQYREEDFPAEDYGLWLRLSKDADLGSIPVALLFYRKHNTNVSRQHRQFQLEKQGEFRMKVIDLVAKDLNWGIISEQTKMAYAGTSYRQQRKILAVRDLATLRLLDRNRISLFALVNFAFKLDFLHLSSIHAIFCLIRARRKRRFPKI
jgi:glycosyltransferase involved in cell wall biosynthesis